MPDISEEAVEHYAEDYSDALRQAKENPDLSQVDSDVLQYFAIDVWAYDIAAPGVGCTGEQPESEASETPSSTTSSTPSATSTAATVSSSRTELNRSASDKFPGMPYP